MSERLLPRQERGGDRALCSVAGGAVHDALVALAAVEHGAKLATRDNRARATYEIVGADVVVSASSSPSRAAR